MKKTILVFLVSCLFFTLVSCRQEDPAFFTSELISLDEPVYTGSQISTFSLEACNVTLKNGEHLEKVIITSEHPIILNKSGSKIWSSYNVQLNYNIDESIDCTLPLSFSELNLVITENVFSVSTEEITPLGDFSASKHGFSSYETILACSLTLNGEPVLGFSSGISMTPKEEGNFISVNIENGAVFGNFIVANSSDINCQEKASEYYEVRIKDHAGNPIESASVVVMVDGYTSNNGQANNEGIVTVFIPTKNWGKNGTVSIYQNGAFSTLTRVSINESGLDVEITRR